MNALTEIYTRRDFIPFLPPIHFDKFDVIGVILDARIKGNVNMPRRVFGYIEDNLEGYDLQDTNMTLICKDLEGMDTEDFAICFRDCKATVSKLEYIL